MYTFPLVPFRYSKTLTIGIVIVVLCLLPSSELSKIKVPFTFTDVVIHFLMFFAFSAALFIDLTKKRAKYLRLSAVIVLAIIISVGLGILTELMQFIIVPLNRSGNFGDLLSDFLGSIVGTALIAVIKRKSSFAP